MNGIEIDITITMGETCSNTMSLQEARMLYDSLGDLFNNNSQVEPSDKINESKSSVAKTNSASTANPKEVPVINRPETSTIEEQEKNKPSPVDKQVKAKMPQPNPKVEAARERTARRTRNCGSR